LEAPPSPPHPTLTGLPPGSWREKAALLRDRLAELRRELVGGDDEENLEPIAALRRGVGAPMPAAAAGGGRARCGAERRAPWVRGTKYEACGRSLFSREVVLRDSNGWTDNLGEGVRI
jgi:hypothetical protein